MQPAAKWVSAWTFGVEAKPSGLPGAGEHRPRPSGRRAPSPLTPRPAGREPRECSRWVPQRVCAEPWKGESQGESNGIAWIAIEVSLGSLLISLASLVVAILALVVRRRQARAAEESVELQRKQREEDRRIAVGLGLKPEVHQLLPQEGVFVRLVPTAPQVGLIEASVGWEGASGPVGQMVAGPGPDPPPGMLGQLRGIGFSDVWGHGKVPTDRFLYCLVPIRPKGTRLHVAWHDATGTMHDFFYPVRYKAGPSGGGPWCDYQEAQWCDFGDPQEA